MRLYLPIAVQPYLKTYLSYHHQTDPFVLTEKNRFGSYLINCLRFKTRAEGNRSESSKIGYRTSTIQIEIPEHYWWNNGTVITAKGQFRFNNFLLDEFQDRLMDFVVPNITRKGDLNILLLTFREKYNICEDELPLKTLQKMYQRETQRLEKIRSA